MAGALRDDRVRAGEDPGELGVVVLDRRQRATDVGEQSADLLLAGGQSPLGEHDLGIVREQVQDAATRRRGAGVVEGLEVLEGNRLALLVGHRLSGDGHGDSLSYGRADQDAVAASRRGSRMASRSAAWAARWAKAMIGPRVAPPAQ